MWMTHFDEHVFQRLGGQVLVGGCRRSHQTCPARHRFYTVCSLPMTFATSSNNSTSKAICVTLEDMTIKMRHRHAHFGWDLFWNRPCF